MHHKWSITAATMLVLGTANPMQARVAAVRGPSPCTLVTREEAAEAWGAKVPAGIEQAVPVPVPGGRTLTTAFCMYGSAVSVSETPLGGDAKHLFALLRQDNEATKAEDLVNVPGLGDGAFYGLGKLTILKGSTLLEIGIAQKTGFGPAEFAIAKRLGGLALSRL
jgi:hypothetical protein